MRASSYAPRGLKAEGSGPRNPYESHTGKVNRFRSQRVCGKGGGTDRPPAGVRRSWAIADCGVWTFRSTAISAGPYSRSRLKSHSGKAQIIVMMGRQNQAV